MGEKGKDGEDGGWRAEGVEISHPEPSIPKESLIVHILNFASRSYAYDVGDEDNDDHEEYVACFRFFLLFN